YFWEMILFFAAVAKVSGVRRMADPQHGLKVWVSEEIEKGGYGTAQRLADHLGVKPHFVSRLKNTDGAKQMRRIDAHLIPPLVSFFGSLPPGFEPIAN